MAGGVTALFLFTTAKRADGVVDSGKAISTCDPEGVSTRQINYVSIPNREHDSLVWTRLFRLILGIRVRESYAV